MIVPLSREVELLRGRFDGLRQFATPSEQSIVLTEIDPVTRVSAQYIYARQDDRHFVFDKCYEIN